MSNVKTNLLFLVAPAAVVDPVAPAEEVDTVAVHGDFPTLKLNPFTTEKGIEQLVK